jgi:PAS domain-containing protein
LLVIKGNRAAVIDLGSSNGVFVNGILVRKQRIEVGDEVVISDFKIRIAPPPKAASRARVSTNNVDDGNLARELPEGFPAAAAEPAPQISPQEKLQLLMDRKVLMPFYTLMQQVDWRALLLAILGGALLLAVFLSILPVVRWGRNITITESLARAHTVVVQTVRENYRVMMKTNDFSRLTVEACESAESILSCVIVDPHSNTILAPVKVLNQPLEDIYMRFAMKKILDGEEESPSIERDNGNYVIAEPIYIQSREANEKTVSAIVIADFEIPSKVYSMFEPIVESALFAILCSLMAYYLIFKMFTYPILTMQEQLDAALKGDNVAVTSSARSPELEGLATVINFAISRMRQAGGGLAQAVQATDPEGESAVYENSVQEFDQGTSDGILLLDRDNKVAYVGRALEDLLGMRNQYAKGQNISDACRDQSFAGTAIDMAGSVMSSLGETQTAQLDINGTTRNMVAVAHKTSVGEISHILITVKMGA